MKAGDLDKAKEGISDDFLDALTAIGTADEVRAGGARYRDAGATSPCVGPVPRTDFAATLEAADDCRLRTAFSVADSRPSTTLNYVTDGVTIRSIR